MTTHVSTAPHQSRKKRELTRIIEGFKYQNGGERGIRTLETLQTFTHFPGVLLQPLGHLTVNFNRFSALLTSQQEHRRALCFEPCYCMPLVSARSPCGRLITSFFVTLEGKKGSGTTASITLTAQRLDSRSHRRIDAPRLYTFENTKAIKVY